ncbi:MAG: UDP-N-acetylglucosamine--N-acetylmuramyl-(pentapeptide) pyrophosphoryl-undecaprenol N-acetylglucosamine transferase [Acidimicrobiales bacterium]
MWAVIAGGGTAGHVEPGLAVATELVGRGHTPDSIRFIGGRRGIETRLVPAAGFVLQSVAGRGVPRRLTRASVVAAADLVVGCVQGIVHIARLRPSVVVGLGGYGSLPAGLGAAVMRIPLILMEQNAHVGGANRILARFSAASAVSFSGTPLPNPSVTGNPVRRRIAQIDRERDRPAACLALGVPAERALVAVFGGSLGAASLNRAAVAAAGRWANRGDLALRHTTGPTHYGSVVASVPSISATPGPSDAPGRSSSESDDTESLHHRVLPYDENVADVLAAADLVVCRSGATTVAELAAAGVPAVLVPLPGSPGDHQGANARSLAAAGAAVVVPDEQLDGERLCLEVESLLADPGRRSAMSAAARAFSRPDAAARVADLVERHARVAGRR